jgi:DNA-binding response OmpR family regulator
VKNILIIEDDEALRESIKEFLIDEGFHIDSAVNGEEGIKKAIDLEPDLIICDITMPVLNGFEVFEILKLNGFMKNTAFMLLTARNDEENIKYGLNSGVDAYLTKPFELDDLLQQVRKLTKI